jgi:amino acid permease
MVAETISLGILSLPAAVAGLGLVPALIVLIGLGLLASYTGYIIGQFKWTHPHISSMADAGEVLMGRFGRELFGTAQLLFLVFIMSSHILTFTVALNVITKHATCSIVFGIAAMIISCIMSLPRTLEKVSWLSLVCEHQDLPGTGVFAEFGTLSSLH